VRTVSQTPTYDQLRGERINADVPASEANPQLTDRPGRHRVREDTPTDSAVPGPSLGPATDLGGNGPRFGRRKPDEFPGS
jgi:hypothetical protein